MSSWSAPKKPAEHAEEALIEGILDGTFPPGSVLPAERELASKLGITRPTLREALQRLARDGWITIQQGKSTQVNDFWRQGGLNVLSALLRNGQSRPPDFIPHLLEVRLHLAPAYAGSAVERCAADVEDLLKEAIQLEDSPAAFATFDWRLHHALTVASGNPVYTLILNGFAGFYEDMARLYFSLPEAREASRVFYAQLLQLARARDSRAAEQLTSQVMRGSLALWERSRSHNSDVSRPLPCARMDSPQTT